MISHSLQSSPGLTASTAFTSLDPFTSAPVSHGFGTSSAAIGLGPEYLLSDSGVLTPVSSTSAGGGSGESAGSMPASTLVGAAGGLRIDLIWDASVALAPTGFRKAIVAAAEALVAGISTNERINIDVGYGEINNGTLAPDDLGSSIAVGHVFPASKFDLGAPLFIASAEEKALELAPAQSKAVDGYIGFSDGVEWHMGAQGTPSSEQYDLVATAEHEISEVMGRIGSEGTMTVGRKNVYTPLDLFNYAGSGRLELSGNGGYFSTDFGATNLGDFNDAAANSGDIGDWASSVGDDAFDAFASPGIKYNLTQRDWWVMQALGYTLTSSGGAAA